MNKQKDIQITGLKVRIKELEDKLGNLFKEFTFTSVDNIQKNWSLFDDQFQKLKEEQFQKQQQQLFASMTGGNGMSGLGLFGGVASGNDVDESAPKAEKIDEDLEMWLAKLD